MTTTAELAAKVAALELKLAEVQSKQDENDTSALHRDMDTSWLVLTGAIVFFMQAGFAMLEAGCVGKKNVINILYKNIMDGGIAAICFWLIGYGVAFGETAGGFMGTTNFALSEIDNDTGPSGGYAYFFFQWAFTGTAATIVSGSVAERTKFEAYLLFSAICSIIIYPVSAHWGWGTGWLSSNAFGEDGTANPILKGDSRSNGLLDYGGSGVVHMLGGCAGLMGAIAVGPRRFRFGIDGLPQPMPGHNTSMMGLGVLILWFGWYGFNCGSTLAVANGSALVAGKIAVTTTISGAAACLSATIIGRVFEKTFDIGTAFNGILAGLVGITAGCAVVEPWAAFLIGIMASWVYYGSHVLLLKLKIDDPLDAFPIHGCCGAWAVISTGIFCNDKNVPWAGYPHVNDSCKSGEQFGVQLIAVLAIASWSVILSAITFWAMKATIGIRVPEEVEDEGLDVSEHGGFAYFEGKPSGDQVLDISASRNNKAKGNNVVTIGNGQQPTSSVTKILPVGDDQAGWVGVQPGAVAN